MKSREFSQVVGETQRTILSWSEKDLIEPIVDARGAGTQREYGARNMLEVELIRILKNNGLNQWLILKIMRATRGKLCHGMLLVEWTKDEEKIVIRWDNRLSRDAPGAILVYLCGRTYETAIHNQTAPAHRHRVQ